MPFPRLLSVFPGAMLAAAFPLSPAALADTVAEISVVAPRPPTAEELAGDSVATYIRSHGKPSKRIGQLGRWEKAPCPATVGLSPAYNEYVTARIRAIESAAAIPQHSSQPCKQQNVLIVFTTQPQAFLDDVAKKKTTWLGFHYASEIAKIKTLQRPVQAWYATATRSNSLENHQLQSGSAGPQSDVVLDDAWSSPPAAQLGSRLSSGLQSWIVFALIVVDTAKVTGYAIGPISDYIAMVTLQQTQLVEGCGQLPSILDLMAAECEHAAPDAVTAADVAYLKALYRIDMAHELSMQRSSVEDIMNRQFKSGE